MFSYFDLRKCSREEALKTEIVFIVAYLKKRLSAAPSEATRTSAPQAESPNAYSSGVRWEGKKATKTISFGDIGRMSPGEVNNFNTNVAKNPKAVMGDA